MKCPNCNSLTPTSAKFCPECATKLSQTCNCGFQLNGNEKFCPECAAPTGMPSVVSPSLGKSSSQDHMHSGYSQGFNQTVAGQMLDAPQIILVSGDVVSNYTIKGKLGQGGFACVYRATENLLEEEHALKVLPLISRDYVKNILLEFKSRDRIKDFDHIIKAWQPQPAVYQGQDILLYPMELADMTFRQWLNEHKNQPEVVMSKGMDIFKQACKGVEAIHNAGLTHLDIKPENILLIKDLAEEEGWIAKVADFGLARGMGMENLAALEDGIGTPAYMAPEQIMAARWKDVGKEADIYALGMILYEMIDGDLPYSGTAKQIKEKKRDASICISPIKSESPTAKAAMYCLNRNPGERPETIENLLSAIRGKITNTSKLLEKEVERNELVKLETTQTISSEGFIDTIDHHVKASYRHSTEFQFGEVHLIVAPKINKNLKRYNLIAKRTLELSDGGSLYIQLSTPSIDVRFFPAIVKGIQKVLDSLSTIVNKLPELGVTVFDGRMHPVKSNEIAFSTAAEHAFREALSKGDFVKMT